MYMKLHLTHYYAAWLKQQHRHGFPSGSMYRTPSDAENDQFKSDMKNLAQGARNALESITSNYIEAFTVINTENAKLQTGIGKLAGIFDGYSTAIINVVKNATFLEQRNKTLNTTLGVNTNTAAKLGEQYDELAEALGDGGENIRKFGENINKILPGMSGMILQNKANAKSLLGANQFLTDHIKLTGDAANSYQLYAAGTGKDSLVQLSATQAFTEKLEKATGLTGTFAAVVSEVADLGADIQTTYNKMPGSLEKSIIRAKLLGTTFAKIEAMATKMLNIEESVGAELEYQLLSGKRLVDQDGKSITEKLRIAKLTGNAEDQVKAMNDLLTTQGDVLDGNNYYAKEQLANLTGFTVAELTRQRQTQKLMEQSGLDKAKIEAYMDMDPGTFQDAIKKSENESTQVLLNQLKENESLKTTDAKLADFLDMKRTVSIVDMTKKEGGQVKVIDETRKNIASGSATIGNYGTNLMDPTFAKALGATQLAAESMGALKNPIDAIARGLPLVGTQLTDLINKMSTVIQEFGTGKSISTGRVGADVYDVKTETEDAMLVNDAMIQFHPADKFATVSDGAALLASTERGKLDSAVNTLTGNAGNGVAVVDPAPIAAAIMNAMRNMTVQVNYDVTAAAAAANFKFNQGING